MQPLGYTKGDAKKPRASELEEVLNARAMDHRSDTKLREQLANSGAAGVKLAAYNRELLKLAAEEGRLNQKTINDFKRRRQQKSKASMVGGHGYAQSPPPS